MVRMQPTCGEYTSKGGASLKTQNKKKEGEIKIDAIVRMEANCGENTPKHRYARRQRKMKEYMQKRPSRLDDPPTPNKRKDKII